MKKDIYKNNVFFNNLISHRDKAGAENREENKPAGILWEGGVNLN